MEKKLSDLVELGTAISDAFRLNFESFSKVIRDRYLARQQNRELQWPPCFAEKLVRLELHQEVYNVYYNKQQRGGHKHYSTSSRDLLEYDDIFQNKPGATIIRRVLVEGDAGIGKTTLCISISLDWALLKRLQQFKLLLLLPLREQAVTSVSSVSELLQLFHPNEMVCKSVADSFLQGNLGKDVLIIADGWDELDPSLQEPGSFIYKLLFQDAIHSATVLITSRPSASVELHKNPYIDRFIEVAGFDIRGIVQYIKSEFSREYEKVSREGLLQQIKENSLIRSICHVPINCAIICHMWRTDESLPADMTMTDIYTKIILHFMLRAFQKTFPELGLESLNSFDAIPQDLQECLSLLCKFAYDALVNDTYAFSYENLKEVFPKAAAMEDPEGGQHLFTFGLMQSAQAFMGVGRGASFHFLHRTFQEYLSALHVVKQPAHTQIKLMKPHAYTSRMAVAMRFIIGLGTSGHHISSRVRPITCNTVCEVYEIDNRVRVSCVGWTNSLVVHGIHEAKEGAVKNYLLKLLYGDYFTFAFPRNAHDCATVVKAIEQFPRAMKISNRDVATVSFKLQHCSLDEDLLTNLAVALFDTEGKLHIKTFLLQDNKLSDKPDGPISMLMNLAAPAFKSLKQLSLAANSLGAEAVSAISEYLNESSLERLTLSYNPLRASGVLALQNGMTMGTFSKLSDLQLKNCSISKAEAFASLFQTLPLHCVNLKQLDISENAIDNPVLIGEAMGKLIQAHKSLSELYANETKFGDDGIKALTQYLNSGNDVSHIGVLSLKDDDIGSEGVSLLVKSSHFSISDCLYLDGNQIGLPGAVSIASILSTKTYSLSNCQLTTCSEANTKKQLKDTLSKLPQSQECQELVLDNNSFNGENVDILLQFVRLCPKLNSLSCAGCEIDSDDLEKLLKSSDCAKSLAELETWSLQKNGLDGKGGGLLLTSVHSRLPKVTGIFIHGNKINTKMFKTLEKEVAKHRPKGDVFERVLTAVIPGVPYDKLRVLVEKHDAYEFLTDEEQDPVLLWDEYCRRGEEQRQQAELIMGWTMSFQDEERSKELITEALKKFSTESQELVADMMSVLGDRERQVYVKPQTSSTEEEAIIEEEKAKDEMDIESSPQEVVSFPDIELAGGRKIPSSIVSSLAAQYLGTSKVTPEVVTGVTQFAQSSFGQMIINQMIGETQDLSLERLHGTLSGFLSGQGSVCTKSDADIDYNAVVATTLSEKDSRDVKREVSSLKAVYYQLGLELGIPPSELDAVRETHSRNLDQALTEVLLLWLRRCPGIHAPSPSWQSLVKAVDSLNGGNYHGLAVDIASRHSESPMEATSST